MQEVERPHRQDRKGTGYWARGGQTHFGQSTQEPANTSTYSPLMSIKEPKIPTAFSRNQWKHLAVFLILCNFSLQREAPFKASVNIPVQAGCVHMRTSKYSETLECRRNTRKWNIDFHLLFQTVGTLLKQKIQIKIKNARLSAPSRDGLQIQGLLQWELRDTHSWCHYHEISQSFTAASHLSCIYLVPWQLANSKPNFSCNGQLVCLYPLTVLRSLIFFHRWNKQWKGSCPFIREAEKSTRSKTEENHPDLYPYLTTD